MIWYQRHRGCGDQRCRCRCRSRKITRKTGPDRRPGTVQALTSLGLMVTELTALSIASQSSISEVHAGACNSGPYLTFKERYHLDFSSSRFYS
ncbi:hypothetical protein BC830DRAFT_317719 [Chytriomyces sp. MP71]|nr:hypothetical protein BC830DRAFT_317719 [Chytriomyces sp. MP71]